MKKFNKIVALTSLSALALSLVAFRYPNREYNQQYRHTNCENGVCLYRENSDYRNNYYNRNTNYNNGHNPYCEENGSFHRHNNLHNNSNHGNHNHNGHNRHR